MRQSVLRSLTFFILALAGCDSSTDPGKESPAAKTPLKPIATSWQWLNPAPQGNQLNCISVAPGGHVFAGGYGGTIMEWNGSAWQRIETVTTHGIWGIWAESDARLVAVTDFGEILRRESGKWYLSFDTDAWMFAVHGNATRAAVIGGPTLVTRGKGGWVQQENSAADNFVDVWVSPAGKIHLTTDDGRIGVWNGSALEHVQTLSAGYLGPIWGNSDTDLYAAGEGATLKHFNGVDWEDVTPSGLQDLADLWTSAPGDLFVISRNGDIGHLAGGVWSPETFSDKRLTAIAGHDETVFSVGFDGRILQRDGGVWNQIDSGSTRPINGLYALSASEVLTCGGGGLVLRVTPDGVIDSTKVDTAALTGIDGTGPNDVYTAGQFYPGGRRAGAIYHFNGAVWTQVHTSSRPYSDVCVIATDSVVVTGEDGEVVTYNGQSWNTLFSPGGIDYQHDMWCAPDSSVFIVGERIDVLNNNVRKGFVRMHKKGDPWVTAVIPGAQRFVAVWGHSSSEIWATTDHGAFWKYNGGAWAKTVSMDGSPWVYALGGDANGDVLVGTQFGVVRAATDFVEATPGLSRTIAAFALLPDGAIWAAGEGGTIIRLAE